MFMNLLMHLLNGILITQDNQTGARATSSIQFIIIVYFGLHELRQLAIRPRYLKSFFNYINLIAIGLAFAMQVFAGQQPSVDFIAFSTAIIWVDMLL